jgi:hypothetical protein
VGIAGRTRGVAHHGRSRGQRRSGVPLDETKGNLEKAMKKLTITTSGERQRGSLRPRRWPGACCCCLPSGFWEY